MIRNLLPLFAFAGLLFSSCIQEEPLNMECDIETATIQLSESDLNTIFLAPGEATLTVKSVDSIITFVTRPYLDRTTLQSIAPVFTLTEGATIVPENGSIHDFSGAGVRYTVTSQDKKWQRTYLVRFEAQRSMSADYHFENYEIFNDEGLLTDINDTITKCCYYEWYDTDASGNRLDIWATGNSGFRISRPSFYPYRYPTIPYENGKVGKAIKLETCDTGHFGEMAAMRIAAGNIFIGSFDTQYALKSAMAATCFGKPINQKPVRFTGYYKWKPGEKKQDKQGNALPTTDAPDIYCVVYRNVTPTGETFVLHGDDVLTSDQIVGLARVAQPFKVTGTAADDEWVYFDIPVNYQLYKDNFGRVLDPSILSNYGYSMSICASSSIEGATFIGAVGSTLIIDEFHVDFE